MTWLVFGVSCLLVLAGAVSIISGAPYIQLERGWAEVISGTVALSSGGVVFALAGILMRLESLRDTLAARTQPTEVAVAPPPGLPATPDAPVSAPPSVSEPGTMPRPAEPAPTDAPEPIPTPPRAAEEPSGGLWKRVKRPATEGTDVTALREHGFPDRVLPDAAEDLTVASPIVVPAHDVPPVAPSEPPFLDGAPPAVSRDKGPSDWSERSLFRSRAPATIGVPARPEPTFDPIPPMPREAPAEARPTQPPAPVAGAEPEPTPDLASELHDGATVVGRYQAGSASYVMYSDGTIEVETESGEIHRFGSMDELKAYIARQDAPVM